MKANQILPINSNLEENTNGFFYKCHFCKETIESYTISYHFENFHQFTSPEYHCEFCETDYDIKFQTKNDLLKHIHLDHILEEEETPIQSSTEKVKNLEEGKSKFLQFISNFALDQDAFSLLHWIQYNDTQMFLNKNQTFPKSFLDDNLSQESFEDDFQILNEDFDQKDSNDINFITQQKVLPDSNSKPSKRIRLENRSNFEQTNENNSAAKTSVSSNNVFASTENYFCEFCKTDLVVEFENQNDLIKHQRTFHWTKLNKTPKAENKISQSNDDFSWDFEDGFGFSETSKENLETSLENSTKENDVNESESVNFDNTPEIEINEENVEKNEYFGCDTCGKSFSNKNEMITHIQDTHEASNKKSKKLDYNIHKCKFCGYSFTTASFLKSHVEVHHKGYICNLCGEGYINNL